MPLSLPHTSNTRTVSVSELRKLLVSIHQEQNKIQELLGFLGYALRSFGNVNQFLEFIPLIASTVTEADGSILLLFKDESPTHLDSFHALDRQGKPIQPIQHTIERIYQEGRIDSPQAWDRAVALAMGPQTHIHGAPILLQQHPQGRLYVYSHNPTYDWNHTRQRLIRLVADQTALGLQNMALSLVVQEKKRQDREIEIGAEIQQQLFPHDFPKIPGVYLAAQYLTADRVGGDYYDFIAIPQGNRWGLVIGDVMGKGVPAGLIMTMTRGMLRAEVLNGHGPARILEHLNQIMYDDLDRSRRFVTLFYSEYNATDQTLTFSNAAHMPALIWRHQTRSLQTLDTIGSIIGLAANSYYEEDQVHLLPGDVVIYYTDGITDASNAYGSRFDEENLRSSFQKACLQPGHSAQSILDYVFRQVQDFIGHGRSYDDDMTMVVLQVQR